MLSAGDTAAKVCTVYSCVLYMICMIYTNFITLVKLHGKRIEIGGGGIRVRWGRGRPYFIDCGVSL